jgi:hypothetical protein
MNLEASHRNIMDAFAATAIRFLVIAFWSRAAEDHMILRCISFWTQPDEPLTMSSIFLESRIDSVGYEAQKAVSNEGLYISVPSPSPLLFPPCPLTSPLFLLPRPHSMIAPNMHFRCLPDHSLHATFTLVSWLLLVHTHARPSCIFRGKGGESKSPYDPWVFLLERGEPCTLLPCLLVFPRSWKECE